MVCFIGGVTLAEKQAAHLIAAARNVDILIGGDDIITPTTYVAMIERKPWRESFFYNMKVFDPDYFSR